MKWGDFLADGANATRHFVSPSPAPVRVHYVPLRVDSVTIDDILYRDICGPQRSTSLTPKSCLRLRTCFLPVCIFPSSSISRTSQPILKHDASSLTALALDDENPRSPAPFQAHNLFPGGPSPIFPSRKRRSSQITLLFTGASRY